MSEIFSYDTLDELQAQSLPDLTALWELVPTDRQRRYKTVYDREMKQAEAARREGDKPSTRTSLGDLLRLLQR